MGGLGVATGFGILAFYAVIAGWTLWYLWEALRGGFSGSISAEQSQTMFVSLTSDPLLTIFFTAVFLALTVFVVRGGISKGIERTTKILMPLLLVILILLAIRSVTLEGGMEGLVYLFKPDFSKITFGVVMNAMGQALFSLSLGMGAMITYGSYFPKRENLPQAGAAVALFDTMIALLAGVIIFPAIFAAGVDPGGGPGLVFIVLPTIFGSMPAGSFFAIAFYALLAIAALTSTISLLEVVVAYFVDERDWKRPKAAITMGAICFVIAIPSALAAGGSDFFPNFFGSGIDFLSLQNIIWGNYSLGIGALLLCVFVGWKWGVPKALESLESGGYSMPAGNIWGVLIRYVCPLAVGLVIAFIIITQQYM